MAIQTTMYPTPANVQRAGGEPANNLDPWAQAAKMAQTMRSLRLLGAGQPYPQMQNPGE